jgi:hypothetical protein
LERKTAHYLNTNIPKSEEIPYPQQFFSQAFQMRDPQPGIYYLLWGEEEGLMGHDTGSGDGTRIAQDKWESVDTVMLKYLKFLTSSTHSLLITSSQGLTVTTPLLTPTPLFTGELALLKCAGTLVVTPPLTWAVNFLTS